MAVPTDRVEPVTYPKATIKDNIVIAAEPFTPVGAILYRTYDPELEVYIYSMAGTGLAVIPKSQTAVPFGSAE